MRYSFVFCLAVLLSGLQVSAQTVDSSSQAKALLSASVAASGGRDALFKITDMIAKGTINVYSGIEKLQGSVTLKSVGTDEFRFDAELSSGTWSWYVNHGEGKSRGLNGKVTPIPYHNAVSLGLIIPVLTLNARLADSGTLVQLLGTRTSLTIADSAVVHGLSALILGLNLAGKVVVANFISNTSRATPS